MHIYGPPIHWLLALLAIFHQITVDAFGFEYVVTLYQRNQSSFIVHRRCGASGAAFGYQLNDEDFVGCPIYVHPVDGCSPIDPPSTYTNQTDFYSCIQYVAMIERGNCSFAHKAYQAQLANFQSVVVYDNVYDSIPSTMGGDGVYDSKVKISVFLISRACGLYLKNYSFESGNTLVIARVEMDFTKYLMPFVVVVGICFLMALVALTIKIIREKRHEWRRRLSRRKLKRIPTKKYKKSDTPETCPICLEDFDEGERLRILPCSHWYHVKCVDPWLTKNRKLCPVCKRKVLKDDDDTSSSSESDIGRTQHGSPVVLRHVESQQGASSIDNAGRTDIDDDERAPLLTEEQQQNRLNNTYGSTISTPTWSSSAATSDEEDEADEFKSATDDVVADNRGQNVGDETRTTTTTSGDYQSAYVSFDEIANGGRVEPNNAPTVTPNANLTLDPTVAGRDDSRITIIGTESETGGGGGAVNRSFHDDENEPSTV